MAQKGLLSKLSIQFNSKSNSESMEETQERAGELSLPHFVPWAETPILGQ